MILQHTIVQTNSNQFIGYSSWPITFTKFYYAWSCQSGSTNTTCAAELTIKSSVSRIGVKSAVAWFTCDCFSIGI